MGRSGKIAGHLDGGVARINLGAMNITAALASSLRRRAELRESIFFRRYVAFPLVQWRRRFTQANGGLM